eukprot:349966-Chlamydomonas_euryale.AAC.2
MVLFETPVMLRQKLENCCARNSQRSSKSSRNSICCNVSVQPMTLMRCERQMSSRPLIGQQGSLKQGLEAGRRTWRRRK